MKNSLRIMGILIVTTLIAIFVTACGGGSGSSNGGGNGNSNSGDGGGEISMISPYVNKSDMASINEAYSSNANAPWGFEHKGIDFMPDGNLKPFQSVCSGKVDTIILGQNDFTSNWQVNVRIICNSTYSVDYIFEPITTVRADGETQLSNILVSEGQTVSPGDIIGFLYTVGEGTHVHFQLNENRVSICPESYFIEEVRAPILDLIHVLWNSANMCY